MFADDFAITTGRRCQQVGGDTIGKGHHTFTDRILS